MTVCRTIEEVIEAAKRDAAGQAPLTQEKADLAAAILAPYLAPLAREAECRARSCT
jgi:hypothetical protein